VEARAATEQPASRCRATGVSRERTNPTQTTSRGWSSRSLAGWQQTTSPAVGDVRARLATGSPGLDDFSSVGGCHRVVVHSARHGWLPVRGQPGWWEPSINPRRLRPLWDLGDRRLPRPLDRLAAQPGLGKLEHRTRRRLLPRLRARHAASAAGIRRDDRPGGAKRSRVQRRRLACALPVSDKGSHDDSAPSPAARAQGRR
jgi:hypothetical protein